MSFSQFPLKITGSIMHGNFHNMKYGLTQIERKKKKKVTLGSKVSVATFNGEKKKALKRNACCSFTKYFWKIIPAFML